MDVNASHDRERRLLIFAAVGVMAAAIAFRVPSIFYPGCITTDDYLYAWVGRNIISGSGIVDSHGPHTMFPPGYPFAIGTAYLLTDGLESAIRLANLVMGLGVVALAGAVAFKLWGIRIALLAAAVTAANPSLIRAGYEGGSEIAFALLSTAVMFFAIGMLQGSPASALACGVTIGAAVLVRPEAAAYFPVAALVLFLYRPVDMRLSSAALAIGMLMFLAPYSAFMHQAEGTWLPTGKLKTLAVDDPTVTQDPEKVLYSLTEDNLRLTGDIVEPIGTLGQRVTLAHFTIKYTKNLVWSALRTGKAIWLPALLFLPLGLLPLHKLREQKIPIGASLIVLILPFIVASFYVRTRYLVAVLPVLLIWSGRGMWQVFGHEFLLRFGKIRGPALALLLIWLSIAGFNATRTSIVSRADESPEHVAAGKWLHEQGLGGFPVLSRKPFVSFYADASWEIVPVANYERTIAFARSRQVRFVVIDERLVGKLRPDLTFLLDPSNAPSDLKLLKIFDAGPDGRTAPRLVLYELLPTEDEPKEGILAATADTQEQEVKIID
jgi:4-amino-4-deoxy-L-arabinose transferase-like glycosyltransferase